jgi:hypothetical protein
MTLALVTGLVFGLVPALAVRRGNTNTLLKEDTARGSAGKGTGRRVVSPCVKLESTPCCPAPRRSSRGRPELRHQGSHVVQPPSPLASTATAAAGAVDVKGLGLPAEG